MLQWGKPLSRASSGGKKPRTCLVIGVGANAGFTQSNKTAYETAPQKEAERRRKQRLLKWVASEVEFRLWLPAWMSPRANIGQGNKPHTTILPLPPPLCNPLNFKVTQTHTHTHTLYRFNSKHKTVWLSLFPHLNILPKLKLAGVAKNSCLAQVQIQNKSKIHTTFLWLAVMNNSFRWTELRIDLLNGLLERSLFLCVSLQG